MEGVFRATRDAPPSHLRLKVKSFSKLSSSSQDRHESLKFKAGDHHWKLALYPNGNKKSGANDHISLYLVLVGTKKEVWVNFSLFVFDHIRDKYFYVQGLNRFHEWQNEYGFDKFMPLATFKDPLKGFLNNGTCVFGAEVFHIKNDPKGSQWLSMEKSKPPPIKHKWKFEKFLRKKKKSYYSEKFTAGGHHWKLHVYPKGHHTGKGNSVSLYLHLADSKSVLALGRNVVVEYKLRIVDQVGSKHHEHGATHSFNSSLTNCGWPRFMSLSKLKKEIGYLVKHTCKIQAEVIVLGSSK